MRGKEGEDTARPAMELGTTKKPKKLGWQEDFDHRTRGRDKQRQSRNRGCATRSSGGKGKSESFHEHEARRKHVLLAIKKTR